MLQLTLGGAYLAAVGLIGALLLLARRNQRQGWRRRRGLWLDVRTQAAIEAVQASVAGPPLQHTGDLSRLRQSLLAHGAPQAPEPVEKPLKANVLA